MGGLTVKHDALAPRGNRMDFKQAAAVIAAHEANQRTHDGNGDPAFTDTKEA